MQKTLNLDWTNKRTRKRQFLDEMERVVPWSALCADRAAQPARQDWPAALSIETMLRIHFMQNWFTFGDQAMEEALIDTPLYRDFAGLNVDADRLPDAITILHFRHCWSAMAYGGVVGAIIVGGVAWHGQKTIEMLSAKSPEQLSAARKAALTTEPTQDTEAISLATSTTT